MRAHANFHGVHVPSAEEAAEIEVIRRTVITALAPFLHGPRLGFAGHACLLVWATILKFANVTRAEARDVANQVIEGYLKDGN